MRNPLPHSGDSDLLRLTPESFPLPRVFAPDRGNASVGFILGRARHLTGFANVSNLPTRAAPMLVRTVTSLPALSGAAPCSAEARRRGYEIVHPLTEEPWGVRRFFVRDPNGVVVNVVAHA